MNTSPSNAPAIVRTCFGRPTYDGKKHFGTSSPAKPALMVPLPLSITMGALCSREPMVGALCSDGSAFNDSDMYGRWWRVKGALWRGEELLLWPLPQFGARSTARTSRRASAMVAGVTLSYHVPFLHLTNLAEPLSSKLQHPTILISEPKTVSATVLLTNRNSTQLCQHYFAAFLRFFLFPGFARLLSI
jgi:hypothetical protein